MSADYKIISVGGGPAGIAVAIEGIEMGLKASEVLVLEKGPQPIEAIRRFYPDKKMTIANYKNLPVETHGHLSSFPDLTKAETLTYFDDLIKKYDLQMRYQAEVYKVSQKEGIFEVLYGHEKVTGAFVAIGIGILGRPNKPAYKLPSSLKSLIHFDITGEKIQGAKVGVVGGGDTSAEYSEVLVQEKNDVTLMVRSSNLDRMMDRNKEMVQQLVAERKLKLWMEHEIKEVTDQNGKPCAHFMNSEFHPETFDYLVYAIGGTTPINFLKTIGIDCENNLPKYGNEGQTNISGLYLVGDLVCGKLGGSIITAYNSAYRTVKHMVESGRLL